MPIPISMPKRASRVRWNHAYLLGLPVALACQSDTLHRPAYVDPAVLYWDLKLNHHAVTLSMTAPYDTLTVTAVPRNQAGDSLPGLPAARYTSANTDQVVITPEGTLIALKPTGGPVVVRATLSTDNLRHDDSLWVEVVDIQPPPVLANLSIRPLPPDSTKRAANPIDRGVEREGGLIWAARDGYYGGYRVLVRPTDAAGQPMNELLVSVEISDTTVATFGTMNGRVVSTPYAFPFPPSFYTKRTGVVTFYASATAYGVTKVDTVQYRIGWPLYASVLLDTVTSQGPGNFFKAASSALAGIEIRIGTGGIVQWYMRLNPTDGSIPVPEANVVFDDPTYVRPLETIAPLLNPEMYPIICGGLTDGCSVGGNFAFPPPANRPSFPSAYRVFPMPGTYEFRNTLNGARGRIIVGDDE